MKSNASLRKIGQQLEAAESILILPHVSPDGDAMGSSIGLCKALRALGKECHVLIEDEFPAYIDFLPHGCCTQDKNIIDNPDVAICVDCSEENRIPARIEQYNSGKIKLCIDHHINEAGFGDYYYIDETAGAAAELIYSLIEEMDWEIDLEAATCLYVGIVTDTGSFQYSNTTPRTHEISARLISLGVDVNNVSVELFQNVSFKQTKAEATVIDNMQTFADGRAAVSYITKEQLKSLDASTDDTERAIDRLRDIHGVEIAAFIKPNGDKVKVSLRAKNDGDVQQIARQFGGGGHKKAAGCTIEEDMEVAIKLIEDAIKTTFEK